MNALLLSLLLMSGVPADNYCEGLKVDHCKFNEERLFVDVTDKMWIGTGSLGSDIRKRATSYCKDYPNSRVVVKFGNGLSIRHCDPANE